MHAWCGIGARLSYSREMARELLIIISKANNSEWAVVFIRGTTYSEYY